MINVVFLLLVFFLMTATIAPPEPFETLPPESRAESEAGAARALHVGADGSLAWGEIRGDEAVRAALGHALGGGEPLLIRADRRVEGATIARVLAELAAAGAPQARLVTEPAP